MLQKDLETPAAEASAAPVVQEVGELTPESLAQAWKAMSADPANPQRLAYALAQAKPQMRDDGIHFEIGNQAQKEWIERTCLMRLESFLRKATGHAEIKLIVDVPAIAPSQASALHMPSDKTDYLEKNSEEFRALRDDFKLETL